MRILATLVILTAFQSANAQESCQNIFQLTTSQSHNTWRETFDNRQRTPEEMVMDLFSEQMKSDPTSPTPNPSIIRYSKAALKNIDQALLTSAELSPYRKSVLVTISRYLNRFDDTASRADTAELHHLLRNTLQNPKINQSLLGDPRVNGFLSKIAPPKMGFLRKFGNYIEKAFTGARFTIDEIHQENPHISIAQIKILLELRPDTFDVFQNIPRMKDISLDSALTYARQDGDRIEKLYLEEQELIQLSDINKSPREVAMLIVRANEHYINSKPIFGESTRVHFGPNEIARGAVKLSHALPGNVTEVVLTHTHPIRNLHFGEYYRVTPLSSADIASAKNISRQLGNIPFKIRAVVPNGWAYEKTFINGVEIQQ